jgi:micrococcal nuclease
MVQKRKEGIGCLTIILLLLLVWLARQPLGNLFRPTPLPEGPWRTVVRVVDADTLVLENGERIRLIGVDAPETRHPSKGRETCGQEASHFAKTLALGRQVKLDFDWQRYDDTRSRRTLAYVFLDDGTFLNAEIIKQGYAHAYRKFRYRLRDEFIEHEIAAHRDAVGCLPIKAPSMPRE